MKHLIITLCVLSSMPSFAKKAERAENAQVVISNLAQMIGQIGNIIENPHNADNVGNSVSSMVDNIIKITVHAVQNKSIQLTDAQDIMEQLRIVCKDYDTAITRIIVTKKSDLSLLA